jgi:hypothetical protein
MGGKKRGTALSRRRFTEKDKVMRACRDIDRMILGLMNQE